MFFFQLGYISFIKRGLILSDNKEFVYTGLSKPYRVALLDSGKTMNIKLEHKQLIDTYLGPVPYHIQALTGDASLRTYHRITTRDTSLILMYSPKEEATQSFIDIALTWAKKGIQVPTIYAISDNQDGVLLSDFGDSLLLDALNSEQVTHLYHQAMQGILQIQTPDQYPYPLYDEKFVRFELDLFKEWFVQKLLNLQLNKTTSKLLDEIWALLVTDFTSQHQTVVHRDYHSRNLMLLADNTQGIIDFQDAMRGPVTYDFVSLIKDCYIQWDKPFREQWIREFNALLQERYRLNISLSQFTQQVDWTGLQRHIKVLGIFSRLKLRDNKWQYIEHIPRIIGYVREVAESYSQLFTFNHWLEDEVFPAFDKYFVKHLEAYPLIKVA